MTLDSSKATARAIAEALASAPFEQVVDLARQYAGDPRKQVQASCERALRRHARETAERERVRAMYELMDELGGPGVVVGVDEVGRGSIAGFPLSPSCGA